MNDPNRDIVERMMGIGPGRLLPVAGEGQTTLFFEERNSIRAAMSAALVDAPEEKAWERLLDFESYSGRIPGIRSSKIVSRRGNEVRVRYVTGVRVMKMWVDEKYTHRMVIERPYMHTYNDHDGAVNGFWAVFSAEGAGGGAGEGCLLVRAGIARDMKAFGFILKMIGEQGETADAGLRLSPVIMLVSHMKRWIEKAV